MIGILPRKMFVYGLHYYGCSGGILVRANSTKPGQVAVAHSV